MITLTVIAYMLAFIASAFVLAFVIDRWFELGDGSPLDVEEDEPETLRTGSVPRK